MKVGNYVRVVRSGQIFSTHYKMFERLGFKNKEENSVRDIPNVTRLIWRIFAVEKFNPHYYAEYFYGIEHVSSGKQLLVNRLAIEKLNILSIKIIIL